MRILTVPNWSFGRDNDLLRRFADILEKNGLMTHYLQSDVDHNRTVSAFSGGSQDVFQALEQLCRLAFDRIDLSHHVGVHPRIGALDVCPFLVLPDPARRPASHSGQAGAPQQGPVASPAPSPQPVSTQQLLADVETFAATISARFELPVFLYEKSERGRHEADLPSLRKGGFGGMHGKELNPDFGPAHVHPRLGVSVVGVREPLIAMNFNLRSPDPVIAKGIALDIRTLRASGDHRFLGVRALGLPLASLGQSQVSVNLTLPDITEVDSLIEWVSEKAIAKKTQVASVELIGVIRRRDLPTASRLRVNESQIVDL